MDSYSAISLFSKEGPAATELLRSNPLAGFCLATRSHFRHLTAIDQNNIRAALGHPEREILSWFGFCPSSEAIAKIGRKCLPEALTTVRALQLRRVLQGVSIIGIKNSTALRELGIEQHNCVFTFRPKIMIGSSSIYRVSVSGEISTLELRRDPHNSWRLNEHRGLRNQEPSELTKAVVRQWFPEAIQKTRAAAAFECVRQKLTHWLTN